MFYNPPGKPRLAVLYIRTDPEAESALDADIQEASCRRYCRDNRIPVSHSVRVCCDAAESLALMRELLRSLPPEVDTLFAARFYCYSDILPELGALCLVYQCKPIWIYSLDVTGLLYKSIVTLKSEDFTLADQRYLEIMGDEKDAT